MHLLEIPPYALLGNILINFSQKINETHKDNLRSYRGMFQGMTHS